MISDRLSNMGGAKYSSAIQCYKVQPDTPCDFSLSSRLPQDFLFKLENDINVYSNASGTQVHIEKVWIILKWSFILSSFSDIGR